MKHLKRLALTLAAAVLAFGCQSTKTGPTPDEIKIDIDTAIKEMPEIKSPATVTLTGITKGEPPYRTFHLDVTLTNSKDKSIWFVMPYYGDDGLPKDDMFPSLDSKVIPFESYRYDGTTAGGKGQATVVYFTGTKRFAAVRVKAKSKVRLQDLQIYGKRRFTTLAVWEARSLRVNSDRLLEKWLPYNTMSDSDADIPKGSTGLRLDLKEEGTKLREDFPRGGANSIWAIADQKWDVPVKGK